MVLLGRNQRRGKPTHQEASYQGPPPTSVLPIRGFPAYHQDLTSLPYEKRRLSLNSQRPPGRDDRLDLNSELGAADISLKDQDLR